MHTHKIWVWCTHKTMFKRQFNKPYIDRKMYVMITLIHTCTCIIKLSHILLTPYMPFPFEMSAVDPSLEASQSCNCLINCSLVYLLLFSKACRHQTIKWKKKSISSDLIFIFNYNKFDHGPIVHLMS